MNCPTCGAKNDADAHFCAECGTPLENPDLDATIPGNLTLDLDPEATLPPGSVLAASAEPAKPDDKTLAIDQEMLANESEKQPPFDPQPAPPPLPPQPAAPPPAVPQPTTSPPETDATMPVSAPPASDLPQESRGKTVLMIAAAIAIFLVLACCCCSLAIGFSLAEDPALLEDILGGLGIASVL